MALTIWGFSDLQGYLVRPSAHVYVGHGTSLVVDHLPLFRERDHIPPQEGGGSDSRNRQKSSLPLQYLFTCEPAWEQWCHIYNFQPLFFQQYYSYNTGNYGQESEAYTYTYPTGTPAQEQTQLQETNNIDLEKVMLYIECCVMLLFKFCWHFSLLLACMQLSSYSFFRSRSSL